jgi:thiol-disulfide isomerase/thioredoxin
MLGWIPVALALGFVALTVGLQLVARRRAARMTGRPLPSLPGATGGRIAAAERALVYFFTPQCGACRPVTPRMKALAARGNPVFAVDATQDPGLARALGVMATPTTIEVQRGQVVGVHIGPLAREVWSRFGEAPGG